MTDFELSLVVAAGGGLLVGLAWLIYPDYFKGDAWTLGASRGGFRGSLANLIGGVGWFALIIGVAIALGIAFSNG